MAIFSIWMVNIHVCSSLSTSYRHCEYVLCFQKYCTIERVCGAKRPQKTFGGGM